MKICKVSQLSISQIANKIHDLLVDDEDDNLQGLCLQVSRHLAQVLINHGYKNAHVVQGTFTVDNPDPSAYEDWDVNDFIGDSLDKGEAMEQAYEAMEAAKYTPLHYWVMVNDLVIDITVKQFQDELDEEIDKVIIDKIGNVERYIVIAENYVEPKIMYRHAVI